METFKITFYRDEKKEICDGETVEFMAANEDAAISLFQQTEPFAMIIKVEQL